MIKSYKEKHESNWYELTIKKLSANIEFNIGDLLKENDDILYFW